MATVVQQVIRRLDTARDVMSRITPEQHAKVSPLQKSAVIELLAHAITQGVSAENVAMLTDKCVAVNFLPADLDEVLSVLTQKTAEKRRKQQNFLSASSYVSEGLWKKLLSPELDLQMRCDMWVQHVTRLDCINPTEPSVKRWVAELLCMQHGREELQSISKDSKVSLMKHLKTSLKKQVRSDRSVFVYLHELPADPADLASKQPEFYNRLYSDSTAAAVIGKRPAKSPLDQTLVMAVDASFNCRGGGGFEAPAAAPLSRVQGGDMQQCMQMFMNMMGGMMQPGLARDPLANLQINRSRSFAALRSDTPELQPAAPALQPAPLALTVGGAAGQSAGIDGAGGLLQSAGQSAGGLLQSAGQSAGGLLQSAGQSAGGLLQSAGQSDGGLLQSAGQSVGGLLQIKDVQQSTASEAPAPGALVAVQSEVPAPAPVVAKAQPSNAMLDAILARVEAKKVVIKAAKKSAASAASAEATAAASSDVTAAKKSAKAAPAKKAGAADRQLPLPPAKKARKPNEALWREFVMEGAKATPRPKVGMSHETTRSQFLVRVPGTGSAKFRYSGTNAEYRTEAAAKKAALEFVHNATHGK